MTENTSQRVNSHKQDQLFTEATLISFLDTQKEELKLRQDEMMLQTQKLQ
ncbi:hypothetical protein [Chitinophaga flava]|nr:hypothetical protein [Chitinophaga flava]